MIRLLTVIGHGTNLIRHHIEHYLKYVDEIQYIVYETEQYPLLSNEVSDIINGYENVKIIKIVNNK